VTKTYLPWLAVAALTVGVIACTESASRQVLLEPTQTTVSGSLAAPTLESPATDAQLTSLRPALTVRNSAASGSGARTYEFQLSDKSDFSTTVASYISGYTVSLTRTGVAENTGGTTTFTVDSDLQPATKMYWRARVTRGSESSAWSSTGTFKTQLVGFNRSGALFDPLGGGVTIGTAAGSTTFTGTTGLRVNDRNSWVRYVLASTLSSGVISVEVEGLAPNHGNDKPRIFSMMHDAGTLFDSPFLFNVQYRGVPGNPDNAISYKVRMGNAGLQYEPDFAGRSAGVRSLNPATTYVWTANFGQTFRLVIREGTVNGTVIYDRTHATPGTYAPNPHIAMLGANDAAQESGSRAGAVYRNFWVGSDPRPETLGSALNK
jgi:hypothetical protein